ncbi:MAG TPA: Ig-like domain-containing protein, partial [Gemmatimonadales bacterium]|nr:Ig-like domain-containing protein [Gemmatimonadales bacterium]
MKLRTTALALASALLSLGCPGNEGGVGGVLVVANVEVAPGIANVILGQTQQLTATAKTASGIAVSGRTVSWSSSDQSVATVSSAGMVTGIAVGGPVRIRATVDGITGDAVVTVRPVPVDHVTVEPAIAGVLVNGSVQLTATAFDAGNGLLDGRSFLWESSNSSIAAVTTTGKVIGQAEGGPVTISATAEGKTGSASVSVSTRPPTRLGFLQQPGLVIAGLPFSQPIRVALQDDFLGTVVGALNPVSIAIAGNPGGATLSGQTTVTPSSGIATFSTLSLNRVGNAYTFLVTSPGLQSVTSDPFDVIAGSANQLAFVTAPSSAAQSGVAFGQQPVLQLKDGSGNNVQQAGVVLTASIASGPAGAALLGTVTATTNAAGVASFTNLRLSGTVGSYTLAFGGSGVASLTSGPIALSPGLAAALFIA